MEGKWERKREEVESRVRQPLIYEGSIKLSMSLTLH